MKSILSGPERQLYGRLVRAFPGHVILAHVALPRDLTAGEDLVRDAEHSSNRHRHMVADFVICRPDFTALAVVELAGPATRSDVRRDRHRLKDELLRAAGIKVLRVAPGDIPSEHALKAVVAALPAQVSTSLMRRAS